MWIFMLVELMFFLALVSAASIVHAGAGDDWAGASFHGLGRTVQLINLGCLLLSGVLAVVAWLVLLRDRTRGVTLLVATLALGLIFVVVQGMEWADLLASGLSIQSTRHAGFYYLIVGSHAAHAVAGIIFLAHQVRRTRQGLGVPSMLDAALMFWGLVVFIWPVLFFTVYP
jgi:heme/copper-type cytochrome/quinol oxidase subunit 3